MCTLLDETITDSDNWHDTGDFEVRGKRAGEGPAGVFMADAENIYELNAEAATKLIHDLAKGLGLSVQLTRPFYPFGMMPGAKVSAPQYIVTGRPVGPTRAMEGFLDWCELRAACHAGMKFARARYTPEQAMRDAASSREMHERYYCAWVADRVSSYWSYKLRDAAPDAKLCPTMVEEFLTSPAWKAQNCQWKTY